MEPLDASFVDCFLAFVNDPGADARAAEKRFGAHPYVARLGLFKVDTSVRHYPLLWKTFKERLLNLRKGLNDADRRALADELNRSQFDGDLLVETPEGKKQAVPVKIGATVDYVVQRRQVVPQVYPTISGMEQACYYALMLIQRERERVRICPWMDCGKFFNTQTTGQRGFCSKTHQRAAEKENKKARAWNSRHPDRKNPIPYLTTRPKRKPSLKTGEASAAK